MRPSRAKRLSIRGGFSTSSWHGPSSQSFCWNSSLDIVPSLHSSGLGMWAARCSSERTNTADSLAGIAKQRSPIASVLSSGLTRAECPVAVQVKGQACFCEQAPWVVTPAISRTMGAAYSSGCSTFRSTSMASNLRCRDAAVNLSNLSSAPSAPRGTSGNPPLQRPVGGFRWLQPSAQAEACERIQYSRRNLASALRFTPVRRCQ
jgi:hypothetical protein